ncbi:MAG: hypothetical protein ACYCV7_17495, partial [Acidimicrobiales bacterium]
TRRSRRAVCRHGSTATRCWCRHGFCPFVGTLRPAGYSPAALSQEAAYTECIGNRKNWYKLPIVNGIGVPHAVATLAASGLKVPVEQGAGVAAGFIDTEYRAAGADLVSDLADVWGADLVVKVKEPLARVEAGVEHSETQDGCSKGRLNRGRSGLGREEEEPHRSPSAKVWGSCRHGHLAPPPTRVRELGHAPVAGASPSGMSSGLGQFSFRYNSMQFQL